VVSVVEGTVQVSRDSDFIDVLSTITARTPPVRITAGQETRVAKDGAVSPPKPSVVDRTEAWRDRRLTFVDEDLMTIADELNRYNRTKIRVEDEIAGAFRYAVSIDADDPQSLLDVLGQDSQLIIEHRGQEIGIRAR
jgi:ferric-dicitrate binding protein FerR (iron transport regulator)